MDISWHKDAMIEWSTQKILNYFELVMILEAFGQTTVEQSLWIVYTTFRLV